MRFSSIDATRGLSDNNVRYILQLRDGRMALTTLGNINIYNGASFQYVHSSNGDVYELQGYHGAYHVYEDDAHRLWLKDTQRVSCFSLERNAWETNIDSLLRAMTISTKIDDLFFDNDGQAWYVIGTDVRTPKTDHVFAFPKDDDELLDLAVEADTLYLFFSNGDIVAYNVANGKLLYRSRHARTDGIDTVLSMAVYADGCFFQLRCKEGLGRCLMFDTRTRQWQVLIDVPYDLHTIALCADHTALVCSEVSLWSINLQSLETQTLETIVVDGVEQHPHELNSVCSDRQGGIWLGTYNNGVFYYHPYQFCMRSESTFNTELSTLNSPSYPSLQAPHGWTWTCTTDGLQQTIPDGSTRKYYTEDGLSNNSVQSLALDQSGNLWVATANGITKVQVNPDSTLVFESFFQSDGALAGGYYPQPSIQYATGEIAFQGENGWTVIDPKLTNMPPLALTPLLTSLSVSGEMLSPYSTSLSLDHTQNTLELEYAALNYAQPSHTQFRYRLLSEHVADTLWTVATASSHGGVADIRGLLHLTFDRLTPGCYTLEVEATNKAGTWLGGRSVLTFEIHQAWWRTWWAYTLYFLIGALLIALAVYIWRQRELQRRRERILLLRIQNLIQLVNTQETDDTQLSTSDAQPSIDPLITRAVELIEQNLTTPGYSVEQLSRDLCMERTGLYKKISTLLDQSPSALIRTIRLRHAVELIKTTDLPIQEIAERTGFYSSSHLGRCIQNEYGCTASELRTP